MIGSNVAQKTQGRQGRSQHQPGARRTVAAVFQAAHWTQFIHPDDDYRRREAIARAKASVLHGYARISVSTFPTARLISQLTGICHRHVQRVLARAVRQGYLSEGKAVYRDNRLQYVVRQLDPNALQSGVTSTRNRAQRDSLKRTALDSKQDTHDTPRQKTTAAGAVLPDSNSPSGNTFKPFRTPRQVFETACRLVGRDIAVWTFYRALKYGREHGLTLDKCVPFSTSYYVRSYLNFCHQFEQQQQDAIFEVVEDRLHDEQLQWPPSAWSALDHVPRQFRRKAAQPKPASQEMQSRDHEVMEPTDLCDHPADEVCPYCILGVDNSEAIDLILGDDRGIA